VWAFFDWLRWRQALATMPPEHALGRQGEDLAHRFLQRKGYQVVDRNWRSRKGLKEVDLMAWDQDRFVLVEVKTRRNATFAAPERNIDQVKVVALRAAAREYCRYYGISLQAVRFDFIGVVMEPALQIEHETDAITLFNR
jgi:putative endonuclease